MNNYFENLEKKHEAEKEIKENMYGFNRLVQHLEKDVYAWCGFKDHEIQEIKKVNDLWIRYDFIKNRVDLYNNEEVSKFVELAKECGKRMSEVMKYDGSWIYRSCFCRDPE